MSDAASSTRRGSTRLLTLPTLMAMVVTETAGVAEAWARGGSAALHRPDVVLMDLKMPVLDGVSALRRLRAEQPSCHVLALTTFDDDDLIFEALRAGAVGHVLKDVSADRLVEAIRAVSRGEHFLQATARRPHSARGTSASSGRNPSTQGQMEAKYGPFIGLYLSAT